MAEKETWTAPMWNALISRQATEEGARLILNTMVPDRFKVSVEEHLVTHFEWRRGVARRTDERKLKRKRKLMDKIRGKLV